MCSFTSAVRERVGARGHYLVGIGDECDSGYSLTGCFTPSQLTINVGDTVTFYNYAGSYFTGPHNVVADDRSFRCAKGCDGEGGDGTPLGESCVAGTSCSYNPSQRWRFSRQFNAPGIVKYHDEVSLAAGVIIVQGEPTAHGAGVVDLPSVWTDRFVVRAATSGQGFAVQVIPDQTPGNGLAFVSWFTFDTVIGGAERQRWYTLQGPVVTGQPTASLTIYQNTGGNFNAPPATNAQAVGTATLSFDTCSSGHLSYTFTDGSGRAGTIPLTRLLPNVTCSVTTPHPTNADFAFSGSWYAGAATSGQGMIAEVAPNSERVLLVVVYVCAERRQRRGRWTTMVYGARGLYAGVADDTGADLRDHRREVRHIDASWPGNGAGGYRHDDLPELFGRDVQLQLHRRKQHWFIWNHHAWAEWVRCLLAALNNANFDICTPAARRHLA